MSDNFNFGIKKHMVEADDALSRAASAQHIRKKMPGLFVPVKDEILAGALCRAVDDMFEGKPFPDKARAYLGTHGIVFPRELIMSCMFLGGAKINVELDGIEIEQIGRYSVVWSYRLGKNEDYSELPNYLKEGIDERDNKFLTLVLDRQTDNLFLAIPTRFDGPSSGFITFCTDYFSKSLEDCLKDMCEPEGYMMPRYSPEQIQRAAQALTIKNSRAFLQLELEERTLLNYFIFSVKNAVKSFEPTEAKALRDKIYLERQFAGS